MKVSVLIPFFDDLRDLPAALEGLAAQTFRDFEVVLVADGSPESVVREAGAMAARFFPVRTQWSLQVYAENRGPGYARNYGILFGARGEYIAVQDSDDVSMPGRLASAVKHLDAGADLFYSDILEGTSPELAERIPARAPETITEDQWLLRRDWFGIRHNGLVYRRRTALLYPYPAFARGFGEDTLFLMQMGLFAKAKLAYDPEPLVFARVRPESLSHSPAARQSRKKRHRLSAAFFDYYYRLGGGLRGGDADSWRRLLWSAFSEAPGK